jgi:hypothetical protein
LPSPSPPCLPPAASNPLIPLPTTPYVAGPYVEGSCEIELAVTPDLIAALKTGYRDSFEAGQLQ